VKHEHQAGVLRAYPNPFRSRVGIHFTTTRSDPVRVAVHDLAGRRVRTLHRGGLAPGDHAFVWDGHDAQGRPASPGLYVVRVEADGRRVETKMFRLR
jgi:flagellar hook assembly protein FlgD